MGDQGYWTEEDTFSPYFHTLEGQIEYCLAQMLLYEFRRNLNKFPIGWYGGYNSLQLYLIHPSYSPFVDHPRLGKPKKDKLNWKIDKDGKVSNYCK